MPQRVKSRTRWPFVLGYAFAGSGSILMPAAGNNAGRVATLLDGRVAPFSINLPADPVPSGTVINVPAGNFSELQTAINTAGAVVNVPAGTYTGSLSATATNVEVVASTAAFITGNLTMGGGPSSQLTRFRWTGGNIGRLIGSNFADVLIDNLYAFSGSDMHELTVAGREISRFAIINSTFDNDGWTRAGSGYPFFLGRQFPDSEAPHFDVFLGNVVALSRNGPAHTVRINSVRRLQIVDCVFNPDGGAPSSGIRLHNDNTNVWLKDHWQRGVLKIDSINPDDDFGPSVVSGVFDNVRVYHSAFAFDGEFSGWTSNSGVLSNSTFHRSTGGDTAALIGFTDGGGNSTVAWDGVTVPDYSMAGAIR